MTETERCLCGADVPAGDTGLCVCCEADLYETVDELVEADSPDEASFGPSPEDEGESEDLIERALAIARRANREKQE